MSAEIDFDELRNTAKNLSSVLDGIYGNLTDLRDRVEWIYKEINDEATRINDALNEADYLVSNLKEGGAE